MVGLISLRKGFYIFIFQLLINQFSLCIWNSRSMDISHDHRDFGAQIWFLGFEGLFLPFLPPKTYISSSIRNSQSMDWVNHTTTDFWAQIPFLGSEGFSTFWLLKVYIFFICTKFPIDECITWVYWFWSRFGIWRLFSPFLPWNFYFHDHRDFWALRAYFYLFDPYK
jgi:hypothetical protein